MDGLAGGNTRSRRRVEDLKSRRGNVVLAQLAERDEARVLRVRTRERIPSDVFTEDIDQDVVPANLRAFELDEVPYIEDAERPHVDPGLLQGLPDRSRLHRLSDLQGPARQAPPALVRFGATLDQENSSISEHDCADRGDRALWELVPRRHRSGKSMRAINPTSEPRKCSRGSRDRNRRTCAGATRTGEPRSCAGSAPSGCQGASADTPGWRPWTGTVAVGGGAPLGHVRARSTRPPACCISEGSRGGVPSQHAAAAGSG